MMNSVSEMRDIGVHPPKAKYTRRRTSAEGQLSINSVQLDVFLQLHGGSHGGMDVD